MLGASLTGQKRYADAEAPATMGYRGMLEKKDTIPLEYRNLLDKSRDRASVLYKEWENPEKERAWRQTLSSNP